jgi:23S rRNA pseudouridine1911/1915/1917 synthase
MDDIRVLWEDNHLLGVNKPGGWLVQGDETGDPTLLDWAKEYIKVRYDKPGDVFLGLVHRLDRPVSGAVVFARTSKALTRMNKLFQSREVKKTYVCLTTERPDPLVGKLTHYVSKDRSRNKAKAFASESNRARESGAKESVLEYELIGEIDGRFLIRVNPHTGRPHQIRVQMADLGCPIFGDTKYGSSLALSDGTICLHSLSLDFVHPVKKEPIQIKAELPDNSVWETFRELV